MLLPILLSTIKFNFFTFIANHLVNIPLSRILGLGKYVAFAIAVLTDLVQIVIYYNVLNHTALGSRFHWTLNKKLYDSYKKPEFMSKLHDNWLYFGVFLLSFLPIYFGGLFASVFTAHILKLERIRSFVVILIGSLIGCFVWTVGVWTLVDYILSAIKSLF